MQRRTRILAVAVALTFLAAGASAREEPIPTPRPSPSPEKPKREDLPTCTSKRVSVEQMRAAYNKTVQKTGEKRMSRAKFDEIGDELGCRWPESGEEGGQGLIELLEKGGGESGMRVKKQ